MKHKNFIVRLLLAMTICVSGGLRAENVYVAGNWTTPGLINGDLVVTNGNIAILSGDLVVTGDVKVTSGYVNLQNGNLKINGDLIVTNTQSSGNTEAYVYVVNGDVEVGGGIITKSTNGHAYVLMSTQNSNGTLRAGRISTDARFGAWVDVPFSIKVVGGIVTRSRVSGDAVVKSWGDSPLFGDIMVDSICTYANSGRAYVEARNGHIMVNNGISTFGTDDAYVQAEGNILAGSIFARSGSSAAYVSGERVDVIGDIRTQALNGQAHVEARETLLPGRQGTFEDVIAQNIYTRGARSSYVKARRSIGVRGDIYTWDNDATVLLPPVSAVSTDGGWIKAQNIITVHKVDASIKADQGIDVSENIITVGGPGFAHVYSNHDDMMAGNITTSGGASGYVESTEGDVLVKNVISTKTLDVSYLPGVAGAYVQALGGTIEAEKIFTDGVGAAYVVGDAISVKGPISTISLNSVANVGTEVGNLSAGAISTDGIAYSAVNAFGSITVREDIRTKSSSDDAYVYTPSGNISARSIKTVAAGNDSIGSDSGAGEFELFLNTGDSDYTLTIKNSSISLNSDYEWNTVLDIVGTCTLNGKGHHINFTPRGGFFVTSGSTLVLRNIDMINVFGSAIACADDTATIKFEDVTWSQASDTQFTAGKYELIGDLRIKGPGTHFDCENQAQIVIDSNSTLLFDEGVTLSYASSSADRIAMIDTTSRLHFDGSSMNALETIRLTKGTLLVDNFVTFTAFPGKTIYFGNGFNPAQKLSLEFGKAAKLSFSGNLVNQNG